MDIRRFVIIHASRGRPVRGLAAAQILIDARTSTLPLQYVWSLDEDDSTLATYQNAIQQLSFVSDSSIVIGANNGAAQAQNRAAATVDITIHDLIIVHADDIWSPPGWDTDLLAFVDTIVDPVFLVHLMNIPNSANCAIVPILSGGLYLKLGYLFHPDYRSMYSDNDLFMTALRLGAVQKTSIGFRHEHYTYGLSADDATYRRTNCSDNYRLGHEIYSRREREGFPV